MSSSRQEERGDQPGGGQRRLQLQLAQLKRTDAVFVTTATVGGRKFGRPGEPLNELSVIHAHAKSAGTALVIVKDEKF